MAQTSKEIRAAYDAKTYKQYIVRVRKDSKLYSLLESYDKEAFGSLVRRLLADFFEQVNTAAESHDEGHNPK